MNTLFRMNYKLPKEELANLVKNQLLSFVPSEYIDFDLLINTIYKEVLPKVEYNISHSDNKYFVSNNDGEGGKIVNFNPFNSVQWMIFLYTLSHELYKVNSPLADAVYYLNKIMNCVELFYAIELPSIWSAEHPVASVMGRATYGDHFFFYHGCTVGTSKDRFGNIQHPVIGENVHMYANSSIIGRATVGDNVIVGAGTMIKNEDVPSNCMVFGQSPNLVIKPLIE